MYTIKQLKKMSTERLHKIFQKIKGYMLFNPYEERTFMIVSISTIEMSKPVVVDESNKVKPVLENEIAKVMKSVRITARCFGSLTADEIHTIENEGVRGRKNIFNYEQAMNIFTLDSMGATYKQIAAEMNTSYQMIYQVLNGDNYNWIFKMTPEYIYEQSIKYISEQLAIPFIVQLKYLFNDLEFSAN